MVRRLLRLRLQTQSTRQLPIWPLSNRKDGLTLKPQQISRTTLPQNTSLNLPCRHHYLFGIVCLTNRHAARTLLAGLVCLCGYHSQQWLPEDLRHLVVLFMGDSIVCHRSAVLCLHLACLKLLQRRRSSLLRTRSPFQGQKRWAQQICPDSRLQKNRFPRTSVSMINFLSSLSIIHS